MPMGFNVGATISLGDMETVLDYLNDEDMFKPEIDKLVQAKGARTELFEAPNTAEVECDEQPKSDEPDDEVLGLLTSDTNPVSQVIEESTEDQADDEVEDLLIGIPGMGPRRTPRPDEDESAMAQDQERESLSETPVIEDVAVAVSDSRGDIADTGVEDIYIPGMPRSTYKPTQVQTEYTAPIKVEPEVELELEDEDDDDLMGLLGGGDEEDDDGVEIEVDSSPKIEVSHPPAAPSPSYAPSRKSNSGIKSSALGRQVESQVEQPAREVYPGQTKAPTRPIQSEAPRISGQAPVARQAEPPRTAQRAAPSQQATQPRRRPAPSQAPKPRVAPVVQENYPDNTLKRYEGMPIPELWRHVQRFMAEHGMKSKPASVKQLELEFGRPNITRLISQSYLISLGGGKVTAGR